MGSICLAEYLISSRRWVTDTCQASLTGQDCVHVVLGNQAADLDSVVSSLVYGFFLYQMHLKEQASSGHKGANHHFIPVVNCPKKDYVLHTEVVYALEKVSIKKDMLVFIDEIDLASLKDRGVLTALSMVDHNVLAPAQIFMKDIVVKVIDHHEDACEDLDDTKKVIEPVGSCSTLIAEHLITHMPGILTQDIATLLVTTILTDTFDLPNVKRRDTEKDQDTVKQLSKGLPEDALALFKSVHNAKFDNSLLTAYDILRKDCKFLKRDSILIAVSSATLHISDLVSRHTFKQDIQLFCEEVEADVLIIMCIEIGKKDASTSTSRQIGFWSQTCPQLVEHLITQLSTKWSFSLEMLNTSSDDMKCFRQENASLSRKHVLPILKEILATF